MTIRHELVISRWFLAAALALSGSLSARAAGPERLLLYFNEDNERVHQAIGKLEAALIRDGITTRHRVRLEHVVVDFSAPLELEAQIRASLSRRPAAIIAPNSESAAIAKSATSQIPVIFASYQDPISHGLVVSLARPGGNLTGFTFFAPVDEKRLELLRQVAPAARRLGILIDRYWPKERGANELLARAKSRHGFEVAVFMAETVKDLEAVLSTPRAKSMDAWYVPHTVLPFENPGDVVGLFDAMRKPVIFTHTHFVERGGLLSYQQTMSIDEGLRLWATMIGLVLDGVPAGEIPVERPKSFELTLNVNAAHRLKIALPSAFLKRVDRIVDSLPVAGR